MTETTTKTVSSSKRTLADEEVQALDDAALAAYIAELRQRLEKGWRIVEQKKDKQGKRHPDTWKTESQLIDLIERYQVAEDEKFVRSLVANGNREAVANE